MNTLIFIAGILCHSGINLTQESLFCEEFMSDCIAERSIELEHEYIQRDLFKSCYKNYSESIQVDKAWARTIGGFVAGHVGGKVLDEVYDRAKKKYEESERRHREHVRSERERTNRARARATEYNSARFDRDTNH